MDIWVATSNTGKLKEFNSLLGPLGYTVHGQKELSYFSSPEESGETFIANARIKANALKKVKPGTWVIADDSGLEVEGLNNLPGVHSARYAGPHARDAENTAKLLKMVGLRTANNRSAQFRCALVAYSPEGHEIVCEGLLKGEIARGMKGSDGFGYDNVFIPEGESKTLAELGLLFKNKHSHRAVALKQLILHLSELRI
ncbi:MAG: RdgB/HAM1 family non-canonical purine NTP pyrophosphatase [Pseudobdellovibrionaceae bacterium]|nr:RdgB/HAM1 family non-canonical purine NTP pyrophosphatase [Bdellovibrionales bacterium]USN46153.1 MAG: RdgB/HAM1 family non-canonical purine NTP pyrophosphatase [Pseudobdellovibrionaceae bacterium]